MRKTIREQEPVRPGRRLNQEFVAASRQSAANSGTDKSGVLPKCRYGRTEELIRRLRRAAWTSAWTSRCEDQEITGTNPVKALTRFVPCRGEGATGIKRNVWRISGTPPQKGKPIEKWSVPRGSPARRFRLYPYSRRTGPTMLFQRIPPPTEYKASLTG